MSFAMNPYASPQARQRGANVAAAGHTLATGSYDVGNRLSLWGQMASTPPARQQPGMLFMPGETGDEPFTLGPEGPRQFVTVNDAAEAAQQATGRLDAGGPRLLRPGEPASLAGQPGRLLAAGEPPVSLRHGTTGESLSSFRSEGARARGGGDLGIGFYATRPTNESVHCARNRLGRTGQTSYVIEFRVKASRFGELKGVTIRDPYTYREPPEQFIGLIRNETGHPDLPFDYLLESGVFVRSDGFSRPKGSKAAKAATTNPHI